MVHCLVLQFQVNECRTTEETFPQKKKKKQWKKHAGLGIHCKKRKQAAILISSAASGDPRSKAKLAAMDGLKLGGLQV